MTSKFENELKALMRREIADKGRAPSFAFAAFAIMVFFYGFGTVKFLSLIKASALVIMVISLLRIYLIEKFRKDQILNDSRYNLLRFYVWVNTVCWSVIFTTVTIEHEFTGIHFMVSLTMLCGFISSSIITLSADLSLYLPFQFAMLFPHVTYMLYDCLNDNRVHSAPLIPVYVMYLIYQLYQVRDFRSKVKQTFLSQLELKDSNEELRKSQQLQLDQTVKLIHTSRLAALGEMAAGIAHEVNNPLAIISASLQQLERKVTPLPEEKEISLKLTGRAQASIERITRIIGGLRLFSQQSDANPKQQVKLQLIIDDTLNFCGEMLKARYVKLHLGEIPDVMVECNPVQISQVLINLIKNAEDALTDEKNDDERWVKITCHAEPSRVYIYVSNGGVKIPREIQDKLFQPFFTTKGVGKGTGLGLSISQGIMKEHSGDLIFKEDEYRTTFAMQLPIKGTSHSTASSHAGASRS